MTRRVTSTHPGHCMSMSHFEELFARRAIRTWVDWGALDDSNCTVNAVVVADREALRSCQTVWYRNGGVDTDWRDQSADRVLVGEAADQLPSIPDGPDTLDVPHVFPALSLGGEEVMLLDGNHRAVALAASHHAVHVLLIVIEGPKTHLVFPDLVHETHGTDNPGSWRDCVAAIDDKFGDPPEGAS